jgi:type VI secretion system protein ImpL
LATLRNLPAGYAAQSQGVPLSLTFGLYQGDKLGDAAVMAYRRALNKIFRPRLLVHLGNQIRLRINEPDFVREALKAYLMLGGVAPSIDKEFLTLAFKYDWEASFPGDAHAALRQEMAQHLQALLQSDLEPLTLDQQVIDQARAAVLRSPFASQAYHVIMQSDAARRLPEWRISDHAGPFVDRALIRRGGSLSSGVPGIFTYDGFHKVLLPQAAQIATTMARETWVLGQTAPRTDADTLKSEVVNLYLADYQAQWDRLLGEVTVAPFHGLREAADVLNALARPDSPLKQFYVAASAETTLTRPETGAQAAATGAAENAAKVAAPNALKKLLGGALAAGPTPGQSVDDHFKWLHDYVGQGGTGPAPIDDTLRTLNDAYMQINGLAQAGAGAKPAGGGALDALKTGASRAPPRVGDILTQIQTNATSLTSGSLRDQIRGDWAAKVLPFCKKALDNRYPIVRGGPADVTLDDFSRLFKPSGLIDAFFSSELQPFVVTTTTPWQWQKVGDTALGFSGDALAQFQRAAAIRDGFFAAGAAAPAFRLELTPVSLDTKSTRILLDIDGQQVSYAHEPPRPTALQWPGASGPHEARLVFSPPDASDPLTLSFNGPWSLFRLFDAGKVDRGDLADRERITFSLGTRSAVFDVRASSVINPLAMKELGEFHCPTL